MPLNFNLFEVLIHMITLITLVIMFRIFLYKPIKKHIDEKLNYYSNLDSEKKTSLENALKSEEEAKNVLKDAKREAIKISEESIQATTKKQNQIIEEAKAKALSILSENEEELKTLKKESLEKMKQSINEVSIEIAKKILEREVNETDLDEEINQIINEWNK